MLRGLLFLSSTVSAERIDAAPKKSGWYKKHHLQQPDVTRIINGQLKTTSSKFERTYSNPVIPKNETENDKTASFHNPCKEFHETKYPRLGRVYFFTHIPKCAGWSFCADFKNILPVGEKFRTGEDCHSHFLKMAETVPLARQLIMIRHPRGHVLSQHQECIHDKFFLNRAPKVPRELDNWLNHFVENIEQGINTKPEPKKVWVDDWTKPAGEAKEHELGNGWGVNQGGKAGLDDYNCYNPVNMMTRQLAESCKALPDHLFSPHHRSEISYEDLQSAMDRLDQTFFVGISEAYQESLCLLHYKVHGTIPDECNCEKHDSWANFEFTRIDHHIPTRDLSQLTAIQNSTIDRITELDKRLYQHVVSGFLREVGIAEYKSGVKILCRKSKTRLNVFTSLGDIVPEEAAPQTKPKQIKPKLDAGSTVVQSQTQPIHHQPKMSGSSTVGEDQNPPTSNIPRSFSYDIFQGAGGR